MRKFTWTAVYIVFTVLIFYNSSLPGAQSHQTSWLLAELTERLSAIFTGLPPVDVLEHVLRKLAHFFEYFVQTLLCCRMFAVNGYSRNASRGYILFLSLLTGVLDEYLQLTVPARNGAIGDILLDFTGGLTAWATWEVLHWKR
ncbi:MAG: VanZ family protein [Succiniclasticum sp.]|jgi:VanZ family protein|nr:VanZ family protein [Succiniclasticum sp.]MEE3478649.1 VanZ family protein [Succiniclasticum sp.]